MDELPGGSVPPRSSEFQSTPSEGPSWKSASNDLRKFMSLRLQSDSTVIYDQYADYKSESQLFFTDRMERRRKWSLWLLMVLVILTWNSLIEIAQLTPLVADYLENNIICKIPPLQKTNWSFEQIKTISHYSNATSRCYYFDHDYKHLAELPYEEALNVTKSFNQVKVKSCNVYTLSVVDQRYNYLDEYNLLCSPNQMKLYHFGLIGRTVGYFFTGLIADVYGRKFALLVALPVTVVASILTAVAKSYWFMYMFATLVQASLQGSIAIGTILFLEIVHCKIRIYAIVLVRIGFILGCYLKVLLYYYVEHRSTRLHQWLINCTLLLPICTQWLLPESPHWLLCIKNWKAMRRLINEMNYPLELESPADEEPYLISLHKLPTSAKAIGRVLFKPAFRKKLFLGAFLFSLTYLVYYVEIARIIHVTNSGIQFSLIQGTCMVVNLGLVPLMLKHISRPMCICLCLLIISLFYCGATIYQPYSEAGGVIAYICLLLAQTSNSINGLLLIETFPTRVRATAMGICRGVGDLILLALLLVIHFTDAEKVLGMYDWMIYAAGMLVAAFICVLLTDTGDVPLPDTELQAIFHF